MGGRYRAQELQRTVGHHTHTHTHTFLTLNVDYEEDDMGKMEDNNHILILLRLKKG